VLLQPQSASSKRFARRNSTLEAAEGVQNGCRTRSFGASELRGIGSVAQFAPNCGNDMKALSGALAHFTITVALKLPDE
jgi:hypothetical protein